MIDFPWREVEEWALKEKNSYINKLIANDKDSAENRGALKFIDRLLVLPNSTHRNKLLDAGAVEIPELR